MILQSLRRTSTPFHSTAWCPAFLRHDHVALVRRRIMMLCARERRHVLLMLRRERSGIRVLRGGRWRWWMRLVSEEAEGEIRCSEAAEYDGEHEELDGLLLVQGKEIESWGSYHH